MRKLGTDVRRTPLRRQQGSYRYPGLSKKSTALSILGQAWYELVTLLSLDTYSVNKVRAWRKL